MSDRFERRRLTLQSSDGARATLQLHLPADPLAALYWLPALGVGIGPNEKLADALAAHGIAVAVHEWRGRGSSDRRASRRCDWGYRELLDFDIAAGLDAARAAVSVPDWYLGGHSLGGQFALIAASRYGREIAGTVLVASGHPWWRAFPGWRAAGVYAFAAAMPAITALVGHFPGTRLGFAGREAALLMREWAITARSGGYPLPRFGDALEQSLRSHAGEVLSIRMQEDRLAPPGAMVRLRQLAPHAVWTEVGCGRGDLPGCRPDHFGWLREPAPVGESIRRWIAASVASEHQRRATVPL